MKTEQFFRLLKDNPEKPLIFEYKPNHSVKRGYHITEVKHVKIDAVDCGANSDNWNETVVQLWESPAASEDDDFMTAYKAQSILKKVGRMKPYDMEAEIKFEYSNSEFHTAQLYVNGYETTDSVLLVSLAVEQTDCKAKSDCGVPAEIAVEAKVTAEPCCGPESSCC